MRFRKILAASLIAAACVFATAWSYGGKGAAPLWEYKIVNLGGSRQSDPAPEQALNKAGAEGWELVQANINEAGYGVYVFKRPK